ncbi:MAG: phosphoribosylanthranilate isomerase [Desulfobacteraceae bacterium]|nr:MAG: phosphoribosylanthranilate isomerase [Desulfobacteraceae bacterium]
MESYGTTHTPQIKICGLTKAEDAAKCVSLGADAIGLVFFKKSPRYLTPPKAQTIIHALPKGTTVVGVFANEPLNSIMDIVYSCNINTVQLHGNEPPKFVKDLTLQGLRVIKALYMEGEPSVKKMATYDASAYIVECAEGILPGGNAMTWNWQDAADFGEQHPLILAGGLNADNVTNAIRQAVPDAVDVSSGVESAPGKKDMHKVQAFIKAVQGCTLKKELRRVFS